MINVIKFTLTAEEDVPSQYILEGDEVEHALPARWVICGGCNGNGTHVNPGVDSHGISPEEFDEDPQFREDYFGGVYDVGCERCKCTGKVLSVLDDEQLTPEQRKLAELYFDKLREYENEEREDRITAYMESGGICGSRY